MNKEQLKEFFSNPEFVKKLLDFETGEEVQRELSNYGIPINDETLKILATALVSALEDRMKKNELSDSVLNSISGGKKEINKSEEYTSYKTTILEALNDNSIPEIPQSSWVLKETSKLN